MLDTESVTPEVPAATAVPRRVYDPHTPVRPAFEGRRRRMGAELVAGRDHVEEAVNELLSRQWLIAADIETNGVTPALAHQIKVFTASDGIIGVGLDPRDPIQRHLIRKILTEAPWLIFHKAEYDIPILVANGLADIEVVEKVICTLLIARLALPGKLDPITRKPRDRTLSGLAHRLLGLEVGDITDVFKAAGFKNRSEGFLHMDIDSPAYLTSAILDTAVTARIYPAIVEAAVAHLTINHPYLHFALDRAGALAEIERQQVCNRVMLRSTVRGFEIDHDYHQKYLASETGRMESAARELEAAGLRPGVGADLVKRLDADGMLPSGWKRTPKTKAPSSEKDELEKLAGNPLVDAHLLHSKIQKDINDYLGKMDDLSRVTGRIHPQVQILGATTTGRMSAAFPPYQQFNDAARGMILVDPGGWMSIDWTAVEPMVAGFTAGQTDLTNAVLAGSDTYVPVGRAAGLIPADVSDADAKNHPGRKAAKVVLLGLLYGKGKPLLAHELGTDEDTAGDIRKRLLGSVPAIAAWMDQLKAGADRTGQTFTAAGRIVWADRDPIKRTWKGYQAQNYYHQGSAYDCLADAIVEIHRQGMADCVRLAMHDELVVTADAAGDVEQIMQRATGSLARFLAISGHAEAVPGLRLPTDSNPLPVRWAKV